jgi:DNA polymerase-1
MPKSAKDRPHVFLVDGSGYIFRAFHALPPMTRADGTPVNAVYGFTSMLMKLLRDLHAEYVAVIFDAGRRSFRNDIYPQYKAHRPDPPPELIPQFALVREATRACNVAAVEMAGFEADDLIATYATQAAAAGAQVIIVSSDKDLMQLIGDGIAMRDPIKEKMIGPAEVMEKFGVGPERVIDVQALAGDSTDNVPGVPGIGVKTAAQLINEYGDLDTLLARAHEIKQPKRREALTEKADMARLSRDLVRLRTDVPIDVPFESFAVREPDPGLLQTFLKAQAFNSLLARYNRAAGSAAAATSPAKVDAAAPAAAAQQRHEAPTHTEAAVYELVQDVMALDGWIARAATAGTVTVDTETTSLDAVRAQLVGVSLSIEPGRACYIPLGHKGGGGQGALDLGGDAGSGEAPPQIPMADALKRLKSLLEDPAVLKVGHNIKYDSIIFATYGIAVAPIDDSMLISYVLDGGLHGHGMDELAQLHLGHTTIKFKDVTGTGKAAVGFDRVGLEAARDYAAEDADITGRLHRLLRRRLVAEHMVTVYETIERPLVPVIAAMERHGIRVDRHALAEMSRDFAHRLADIEAEIHRMVGRPFNINSPKQLGEVLFDELKLPGGKKGKTGAYATGAEVLDELAAEHPLPQRVLDWRQLAKLKSTYADALVDQIDPRTGRVHTSFAMAATSTGRLSSTDPNLQNIPVRTEEGRKIRRAFVAEAGYKLLSVDYSQIELRLVAEIGGIEALKQAFRDGVDIHALTASQVFSVPLAQMDGATRRKAKAINFGIIYGISGFGLSRQLGCSPREAADYIRAYFERYPGIKDYMERARTDARARGYVTTLFGRRCHMAGIADKNPARRGFAERQAINAPIQGTAADIIKRAMIRVPPALAAAKLSARMLLQVHDELLFEVPEDEVEGTSKIVREVMERASEPVLTLGVPLVADAGVGDNWAEAH